MAAYDPRDAGFSNGGRLSANTKYYYRINCGNAAGTTGDPPWYADAAAGGGSVPGGGAGASITATAGRAHGNPTNVLGKAIYTRGIPIAAPATVYDCETWADPGNGGSPVTYTLDGLVPFRAYGVRSHHVETNFTAAGQRSFHVDFQGVRIMTNLDIWSRVKANTPFIIERVVYADSAGIITLTYTDGSADHAEVAGIEIFDVPWRGWPKSRRQVRQDAVPLFTASGTSVTGTLTPSTAGGAAALAGTSTVTGTLAPSGTGTAALAGTSTITGTLAASTAGGTAALAGTSTNPGTLAAASGGGQAAMSGSPVVTGDLGASSSGGQASIVGAEEVTGTLGASTTGGQASLVGVPLTGDLALATTGGRASIVQTGGTPVEDEWHPDGNLGALVWRPDFYAEPPLS